MAPASRVPYTSSHPCAKDEQSLPSPARSNPRTQEVSGQAVPPFRHQRASASDIRSTPGKPPRASAIPRSPGPPSSAQRHNGGSQAHSSQHAPATCSPVASRAASLADTLPGTQVYAPTDVCRSLGSQGGSVNAPTTAVASVQNSGQSRRSPAPASTPHRGPTSQQPLSCADARKDARLTTGNPATQELGNVCGDELACHVPDAPEEQAKDALDDNLIEIDLPGSPQGSKVGMRLSRSASADIRDLACSLVPDCSPAKRERRSATDSIGSKDGAHREKSRQQRCGSIVEQLTALPSIHSPAAQEAQPRAPASASQAGPDAGATVAALIGEPLLDVANFDVEAFAASLDPWSPDNLEEDCETPTGAGLPHVACYRFKLLPTKAALFACANRRWLTCTSLQVLTFSVTRCLHQPQAQEAHPTR